MLQLLFWAATILSVCQSVNSLPPLSVWPCLCSSVNQFVKHSIRTPAFNRPFEAYRQLLIAEERAGGRGGLVDKPQTAGSLWSEPSSGPTANSASHSQRKMNHKSNAAYRVCEREYFQIRNRNKTKTKQGIIATTFLGYLSVVFGRKQAKLLTLPQKHFHLLVAAAVADKRISTQRATPTHTHTHTYIYLQYICGSRCDVLKAF